MKPDRQKALHYQRKKQQNMSQASSSSSFFFFFLSENLKKFTQIALSFSLFSFIFLHPSWFSNFILSIISHLSKNPTQLLTDKTYIFLLCNGILVFVAKYSSRVVETEPSQQPEMVSPDNDNSIFRSYFQTLQPSMEKLTLEGYVVSEEEEKDTRLEANEVIPEDENGQFLISDGREKEEEDEGVLADGEYEDDKKYREEESESESYFKEEEELDEQEEEGIAKMSTEELNRKFEEFIRKMKEELRIEAQLQLIMV